MKNETFFSNKFSTPIYTYTLKKTDKVHALHQLLAQTLMIDPKQFLKAEGHPEGFNVFWWSDEAVKGTKMVKLDANKTIEQYGMDKNSVLILKYRCRESKYWSIDILTNDKLNF